MKWGRPALTAVSVTAQSTDAGMDTFHPLHMVWVIFLFPLSAYPKLPEPKTRVNKLKLASIESVVYALDSLFSPALTAACVYVCIYLFFVFYFISDKKFNGLRFSIIVHFQFIGYV